MANHRIYHPGRPATNAERAQKCRDKKKAQAEADKKMVHDISTLIDVRQAMLKLANFEELRALYYALAARLHPDNKETGDEEQMKRLTRLWNRYAKEGETYLERKEIAPAIPAIVTPSTVTNSELVREIEQIQQEQITGAHATCPVCGVSAGWATGVQRRHREVFVTAKGESR